MQSYKVILQLFYTIILSLSVSLNLKAQSALPEGTLIYKADTIGRLEAFPAAYIVSQVVVYKKLDQLRIEIWLVNKFNKADAQKDIHIRNKQGTYMFIESSDSIMAASTNFAMFMSYEDEKLLQAERAMRGLSSSYKVDKVIQNVRWLDLPAQRAIVKGGPKNEESEMILTNAVDIPISSVFDSVLGKLPGTPLQFIVYERGWMTRLTADKLKLEKVSDTLFQVNPKRKIMSLDEMIQGISDFK